VEASRAIELDPRLVPAWQARACACEALGLADQAASDYDAALSLAPDHVEIRVARSRHAIRTDPARALVDLEHARKIAPDDCRVLDGCAFAYYELGRAAEGDRCMEHLLAVHPTALGSACAFAHRLAGRGERDRAEQVVGAALAAAPDSPDVGMALVIQGRLGLERWQAGDARGLPAAIQAFDRAADELGEPEAFAGRALVRELLGPGDYQESLRDLDDAIAFDADEASYWVQRAKLHEKHGHARRALADWRHAATLGNPEARAALRRRVKPKPKAKTRASKPTPKTKTKKR
jgi:tetratricopeptide (TPR) repeat protein